MKFKIISDLHGHLPIIENCDALLIGGDLPPTWMVHYHGKVAEWLHSDFYLWLKEISDKGIEIFSVAGNHDFLFQDTTIKNLPWNYLQDSGIEWNGLKIWGTPWQPTFGGWAFNADEPELKEKWDLIPNDTNILICHGPPYGLADKIGLNHVGSLSLRKKAESLPNLKLMVCGHIHHQRGLYYTTSGVPVISASLVNSQYKPCNDPMEFEL